MEGGAHDAAVQLDAMAVPLRAHDAGGADAADVVLMQHAHAAQREVDDEHARAVERRFERLRETDALHAAALCGMCSVRHDGKK
jgi:hypothetical protein